jgi:hypothetical protein
MKTLTLIFLFITLAASAQDKDLNYYVTESRKSYASKDYAQAYVLMTEASKLHPYHQGILYQLGILGALTGRPEESVKNLSNAIHINAGYKLADQPDLATLKDRADFQELLQLQKQLQATVVHSDTAFVLRDRTLHIESVALDASTGIFYLGSVHQRKIVAVDKLGNARDFTAPGAHGLTAVFGVRVDTKRKSLWACSSPMEEMQHYDSTAKSAVSQFDLKSGKLLHQYLPTEKSGHVFGDLVLSSKGDVFVSDSKNNVIFKVNEKTGALDLFFSSTEFWNLQGLTFSDDGRFLFISDYIKGPFRLDLQLKELIKIASTVDDSLKGIDGMTFYRGSLVTLQNGISPFRAMRYTLNAAMDTITGATIIDQAHPAMNEPTIGIIEKNVFYYVGNSQWGGYDQKHQIKDASQLQDIVVLKSELK